MSDDFHSPKAGCTFNTCGVPSDASNCPFTRSKRKLDPEFVERLQSQAAECKHEWRHVSNQLDLRFYCIHCLTIKTVAKS